MSATAAQAMPHDVFRALRSLMVEYSHAVDSQGDPENVVRLFTPDAAIDFSEVGFPTMNGEQEIRAFYAGLVENMTHEFHMSSNYRAESWDGEVGVMTAYVIGMGRAKDGTTVDVKVRYRMECVEQGGAWKCRHFSLKPMMPVGG